MEKRNMYKESTMFVSPEGTLCIGNYLKENFRTAVEITGIVGVPVQKKMLPKGSQLYSCGRLIALILRDLYEGEKAEPKDFFPPLPLGSKWENTEVHYAGKVIYKHPNFID